MSLEFANVLSLLNKQCQIWASKLTEKQLANILSIIFEIPEYITENNHLSLPIHKKLNSTELGQIGENAFQEICKKLPKNYHLISTAKVGKKADFIIEYHTIHKVYKCLVEIKNYKSIVPKKEIDKFLTDLTYGVYDAGLIISYSSKFRGINESIHFNNHHLSSGQIPVMYLAAVDATIILQCIEILFLKISTHSPSYNLKHLENLISVINNSLNQSATTRRLLTEMQMYNMSQMQKCHEHLISYEVHIKCAIKQLYQEMDNIKKTNMLESSYPSEPINNIDNNEIKKREISKKLTDYFSSIQKYNYTSYNNKQLPFVKKLLLYSWEKIQQDKKRHHFKLTTTGIAIYIIPYPQKTDLMIFDKDIDRQYKFDDLLELFIYKNHKYRTTLTQLSQVNLIIQYLKNLS